MDESGFSLSPICGKTWSPLAEPPVWRELFSHHNQSGLGMISVSPRRGLLRFRFTISPGSMATDDFIFWLKQLHHSYGGQKILLLWDGLLAHRAAERYFRKHHPDWFIFEYFPAYSPELNPVEPCWNWMKNTDLANFIPKTSSHLQSRAIESAARVNQNPALIPTFLKYAKLLTSAYLMNHFFSYAYFIIALAG